MWKLVFRVCLSVAVVLLLLFGWNISCFAEDSAATVSDSFSQMADGVADRTGSEVAESLSGDSIENTGERLINFLDARTVFSQIFGMTQAALPSAVSLACTIAGILMICAVFRALYTSAETGAISTGFEFLSSAAMITAIVALQYGQIERVAEFFDGLGALMGSMIPVTGIVWAMGGNITGASAGVATLYAMLTVTQKLCASTVMPVCYTMGMTAICAGLSGGGLLDGFARAVKKIYNFIVAAVMTVFVFVLGSQTVITGAADTAIARGAKLVSSTVIPVVGGAVGDTLRTVAGSVGYIKSVVGVGGIVLILILTLPTLISLLLSRLAILLMSGMADVLGCQREGRLLSELGNIYGFLIGTVAVCSVAFIIALALFIRCTIAVG